nr:class I SAM-dependent methyltransferase [Ruegeria sp. HKCCD4884]
MTGHGYYNSHSAPQWNAIAAIKPWIEEAARSIPLSDGSTGIADFGCSEGSNSIAVMQEVAQVLNTRSPSEVRAIYSDLPTNDFSELFLALQRGEASKGDQHNVYSSVVGGSMYDQLLPTNSISLATTFNTIGFLSRRPVAELNDYILPNGPSSIRSRGSVSMEEESAFRRQAAQDVAEFLKVRAAELIPGGKVIVEVFGCTEDARTCDGIYDALNDAVLHFVENGEISQQTYAGYYQPVYFRSLEELTEPVINPAFEVSDYYSIEKAEAYEVSVPFCDVFNKSGDAAAYAHDFVGFFRAFTEAVLTNALPASEGRSALVNNIYAKAQDLIRENPELYPFRYASVAMMLTRKA